MSEHPHHHGFQGVKRAHFGWLFPVCLLILGTFLGIYLENRFGIIPLSMEFGRPYNRPSPKYPLINPLIACHLPESTTGEFKSVHESVELFISEERKLKSVTSMSIYFSNLNTGEWAGLDEENKYALASLLKVPVMMAYFKQAEHDRALLDKTLVLDKNVPLSDVSQNIKPGETIEFDKPYTVRDLIRRMIIYSDNLADELLLAGVDKALLRETYETLELQCPDERNCDMEGSVKIASNIFRILYNASYLNEEFSQLALELLTETKYSSGIAAGLPRTLKIAHKFGERRYADSEFMLSDCGIVYYPDHPYILCVMSQGKDQDLVAKSIRLVSQLVFSVVHDKHPN